MRRAVVAAFLLATATAAADEPEDPKQAMRDRGIVRKAGKKHYVIIVPQAPEKRTSAPEMVLHGSTIYFGELGKLREVLGGSWSPRPLETRSLFDWRDQYVAELKRNADYFTIVCTPLFDPKQTERNIELTSVDEDAAKDAIESAKILPPGEPHRPFLLARVNPTTYLYVDRSGTEGTNFRLFLGKRGAVKRVPIKEIANDSDALTIITAKGTLTVKWGSKLEDVTWGSGKKKPPPATVLSLGRNRALVRDLGVYTKEPSGHPCHEL